MFSLLGVAERELVSVLVGLVSVARVPVARIGGTRVVLVLLVFVCAC